MSDRQPVAAVNITAQYDDHQLQPRDQAAVIPWEAQQRLATSGSYWFATTRPGGRPHVRPVLGVFVDGVLYTTSNPNARKARNLASDRHCAVSASTDGIDLVVEGTDERFAPLSTRWEFQ